MSTTSEFFALAPEGAPERGRDRVHRPSGLGLTAILLAAGGFIVSWYLIHHGWFAKDHEWDTVEYARYAHLILHRHLFPYSGFALEYPPLAIPIFVIPSMIAGKSFKIYMEAFGIGMAACGVIAAASSVLILIRQRVDRRRLIAGAALVALSPLLLGPVLLSRYDLFPAMLTIAALAAIYFDWHRTAFVLLALGTAAKAYPGVILPLAAIYLWRVHGRRKALECLAWFAAVLAICFVPFLIAAPHGVWNAVNGQASRPPEIESLPAAVFLAAHQLVGLHISLYFTHQTDNINGHPAQTFTSIVGIIQMISLLAVWFLYSRGPATKERLLTAAAAAVCAFIAFDRVLSPQYMIWLPALVATVPGRKGVAAMVMVACAMAMTQIWYPEQWLQLKQLHPLESWAVIARDSTLVAMFVVLAWPEASVRRSLRALVWPTRAAAAPA